MPATQTTETRAWLADQVAQYQVAHPHYKELARLLEQALRRAIVQLAPLAIVQTRPKSIASFAEKALRKRDQHDDPVHQFTDLCGARVIARTRSEVGAICEFVKESFDIDVENSLDCSERLKPTEFGYRSIHYIVSLRPDKESVYGFPVPPELLGKKAEVQVRTVVEHAYADFGHDLTYKGTFKLPVAWERELASVAATLEEADQTFSRIEERLSAYVASYGAYLGDEQAQAEMKQLEIVLEHDPGNQRLAGRLGNLAITRGDWKKAIDVLQPFVRDTPETAHPPVLRDLGMALCKANRHNPRGEEYRRGQRYLEIASGVAGEEEADRPAWRRPDVDALCSLAGSWKGIDETKVRKYYRLAFEVQPEDPYALGNYLEQELQRDPAVLTTARPLIEKALQRCMAHAQAGINMPWAYYDMGKLHLLMDRPYESLEAYCKALSVSSADFMISTSLVSLERLRILRDQLQGYDWARRLLVLGRAARFPSPDATGAVRKLATKGARPIRPPVLIVAGGTDARVEAQMRSYSRLLLEAMAGFEGTVISGGTREGISGLVGDTARACRGRFHTLGYLPENVPNTATVDKDKTRYNELRYTNGDGFTALEPLQNWIDLVASRVSPKHVRVLGINGGTIAGIEYQMAVALGAQVGLIAESGREAGRLLADAHWSRFKLLLRLPVDAQAVQAFVEGEPPEMPAKIRDLIAQAIHKEYLRERLASRPKEDPALRNWDALPEAFKESSRQQARHILTKLRAIGCQDVAAGAAKGRPVELTPEEVERLARMEHGRFVVERLRAGWRWGEKRDAEKKTSPYLASWSQLSPEVQDIDRNTVRKIPELLRAAGRAIRRPSRSKQGKDARGPGGRRQGGRRLAAGGGKKWAKTRRPAPSRSSD
jgi:ppGpp synthetase/RelA/SpoT-type nucleotidyltranferase